MNTDLNIDVRVYPIDEPKGSTVAFASVTFCAGDEPVNAINSIRVVDGDKGVFVAMPQTQDRNGDFQDIAFPILKGLRGNMSKAILAELDAVIEAGLPGSANEPHLHFGAKLPENSAGEVSVEADITPIRNPRGNTVAFGSVKFKIDDNPFSVIEGVRVVSSAENGLFVAMPQSKDKNGEYHDIAFPVMKGLRGQVSEAVLESYEKAASDRSANFSGRLAAGKNKSEEYKQNAAQKPEPEKAAVKKPAKRGAGLGD
ncbi:MAG: SpoVG family protein [Clostridiales bacterium]|jgi:stage V sporulation protein G|nr:SpoVG family protein [Clostridiales bacterium]